MPGILPHQTPLKLFTMQVEHVTAQLGLLRICITSVDQGHGACHYMNATEEETQPMGDDITADAGVFVFHPGHDIKAMDTMQICVKSIYFHEERCVFDYNDQSPTQITNYTMDANTFQKHAALFMQPEIMTFDSGNERV